jgi:apolipoprotein N-acyltransferase
MYDACMDYARIYWLCLLGYGFLSFVNFVPDLLAGSVDITGVVGLVGIVIIVAVALYAIGRPTAADGPTQPNLPFWAVVIGFVLMFAGTVLGFV